MGKKQLLYGLEAQQQLLAGMQVLARTVQGTLGPLGGNIALHGQLPRVTVTRDGASVAKQVDMTAPYASMGVRLLREAATKTKDVAGDGATTAMIVALGMINEGIRLTAAGVNPMLLKRGIDKAAGLAAQAIRAMSVTIEAGDDLAQVITTATGEREIGRFVGEIVTHMGYDGVIKVEEARRVGLEVEYAHGYHFDRGYSSSHFVTNPATREAVVTNPSILVTSGRISSADEIMPVLRRLAAASQRELLVIAEEVSGHALTVLVVNKQQDKFKCVAVKAPEFGEQALPTIEDLAIATGARVIAVATGRPIQQATLQDLGIAGKVIATPESTLILQPGGNPQANAARIGQLRIEIQRAPDLYPRHRLAQRLARLSGQTAIARVGAYSPTLLRERRRMLQHAIATGKVALETGVVPGGGLALLNAATFLDNLPAESEEEKFGIRLVQRALQEPLRCLAVNAGQDGAVVVARVQQLQEEQDNLYIGYDVLCNDYANLMARGIVDTVRMAHTAVENAASVAGMVLTLGTLVTPTAADAPLRRSTYRQRI